MISGASPKDGSSNNSNFGRAINALPIANICRSPPDNEPDACDILWPNTGNKSTTSEVTTATSFLSFRHNPARAKFSFTLNSAITDLPSETCMMPDLAKSSGRAPSIDFPFQVALPDLLSLSPESVRSNVVLPAPLAPITAASCPVGTVNETLSMALIAP